MSKYDLIVRGGTIIDGAGANRFLGDIAIKDGRIREISASIGAAATQTIDAAGLIVAPGAIDLHTHYDAQINWDPYCTSSGWHGSTTVVIGNCGFGYAPCRPEHRERYMRMMETTEQVPYATQTSVLKWTWSTFPEWLDMLRNNTRMGVNVMSYLPLNPLLSYVMGPDESKTRAATAGEIRRMQELLDQAMDAGAIGFSFTYLGGEGNSHVDYDHSPMPTDIMAPEIPFGLCEVLRRRDEGVIQVMCMRRYEFAEELAKRSGRPVIHNLTIPVEGHPEMHRANLQWLNDVHARGLNIWSQGMTYNIWQEVNALEYCLWDQVPIFRQISKAGDVAAKVALVSDPSFKTRLREEFDTLAFANSTGAILENIVVGEASGSTRFQKFAGRTIGEIAAALRVPLTDVFMDLLAETRFNTVLKFFDTAGRDPWHSAEVLRHSRILAGASDGGAHVKTFAGGQWSTAMIVNLVRGQKALSLEEMHHHLSGRTAAALGMKERGLIREGFAADLMIYDFDRLDYDFGASVRKLIY